jgi:hypothetical protein
MKIFSVYIAVIIFSFVTACDVQSGMSKKSVEKYTTTPTPAATVAAAEPIDPADVVQVDTASPGPPIAINKATEKTANCDKYNRVTVNGDGREVTIKGVCSQIMVNGDNARITAIAASEIIVNGHNNTFQYSKYPNGARPVVKDNGSGNTIIQADAPAAK